MPGTARRPGQRVHLSRGLEGRPAKQVALHQPDAFVIEEVTLAAGFHPFGQYLDAEFAAHAQHAACHGPAWTAAVDVAHQSHVDLDDDGLEVGQQVQPRIADTDIVNGGQQAHALVLAKDLCKALAVAYHLALGGLEHDAFDRESVGSRRRQRGADAHLGPVDGVGPEVVRQPGLHVDPGCTLDPRFGS